MAAGTYEASLVLPEMHSHMKEKEASKSFDMEMSTRKKLIW